MCIKRCKTFEIRKSHIKCILLFIYSLRNWLTSNEGGDRPPWPSRDSSFSLKFILRCSQNKTIILKIDQQSHANHLPRHHSRTSRCPRDRWAATRCPTSGAVPAAPCVSRSLVEHSGADSNDVVEAVRPTYYYWRRLHSPSHSNYYWRTDLLRSRLSFWNWLSTADFDTISLVRYSFDSSGSIYCLGCRPAGPTAEAPRPSATQVAQTSKYHSTTVSD